MSLSFSRRHAVYPVPWWFGICRYVRAIVSPHIHVHTHTHTHTHTEAMWKTFQRYRLDLQLKHNRYCVPRFLWLYLHTSWFPLLALAVQEAVTMANKFAGAINGKSQESGGGGADMVHVYSGIGHIPQWCVDHTKHSVDHWNMYTWTLGSTCTNTHTNAHIHLVSS